MKNRKNLKSTALLMILLLTLALPLTTVTVSAKEEHVQAVWRTEGNWTYIENDMITIVFPAGGKKPMFLWWYTKEPKNINVVKYKGLIEYVTFDKPYFLLKAQADALHIRERVQAQFYEPRRHMMQIQQRLDAWRLLLNIGNLSGLHSPYLPFSGCTWELSTPTNVTQGEVKYLSFNFTLKEVPDGWKNLQFAENGIIIACRFYYTPATVDVEGRYTYTVDAGELKMDLIIKHWEWNIDKFRKLISQLEALLGITIPERKAGLALWVNMASISVTQLPIAEADATGSDDTGVEAASAAQNMYVEGLQYQVTQDMAGKEDEHPLPGRIRERFMFRYEKSDATLAGFFKFVPKALLRNSTDNTVVGDVDVIASYIAAGRHMRVYICYPYFGNYTLEHDPSIGLETLPSLVTYVLLLALLGTVTVIVVAILVVRWKKGPVNLLKPK